MPDVFDERTGKIEWDAPADDWGKNSSMGRTQRGSYLPLAIGSNLLWLILFSMWWLSHLKE